MSDYLQLLPGNKILHSTLFSGHKYPKEFKLRIRLISVSVNGYLRPQTPSFTLQYIKTSIRYNPRFVLRQGSGVNQQRDLASFFFFFFFSANNLTNATQSKNCFLSGWWREPTDVDDNKPWAPVKGDGINPSFSYQPPTAALHPPPSTLPRHPLFLFHHCD